MTLKPPKKSDLNKKWMQPRKDRARKLQPQRHLIVSEGTDTEPAYFQNIKDIINGKYRGKIQLDIYGEGDNTINLFHKAKRRAEQDPNTYSHVWIVYDTDDFPAYHVNKVVELCQSSSNEETEFHAIWSNQCVELWYLLHFSFMQSDLHRSEYFRKLTEYLRGIGEGEYTKGRKDMYQILRPYMGIAIGNAYRLEKHNKGKAPSESTPGTKIHELVEILLPYL